MLQESFLWHQKTRNISCELQKEKDKKKFFHSRFFFPKTKTKGKLKMGIRKKRLIFFFFFEKCSEKENESYSVLQIFLLCVTLCIKFFIINVSVLIPPATKCLSMIIQCPIQLLKSFFSKKYIDIDI